MKKVLYVLPMCWV